MEVLPGAYEPPEGRLHRSAGVGNQDSDISLVSERLYQYLGSEATLQRRIIAIIYVRSDESRAQKKGSLMARRGDN